MKPWSQPDERLCLIKELKAHCYCREETILMAQNSPAAGLLLCGTMLIYAMRVLFARLPLYATQLVDIRMLIFARLLMYDRRLTNAKMLI